MKAIKSVLTLSLLASTLATGVVVNAENKADGTEVDSTAAVELVKGGDKAALHIDSVTAINFGKQPISGDTAVYNARYTADGAITEGGITTYIAPTVKIKDDRGTNNGWNLQVKVSEFKSGTNILEGAQLSMTPTTSYVHENPTAVPSNIKKEITDNAEDIIVAGKDQGVGTSSYSFGEYSSAMSDEWAESVKNDKVQLRIPGASKKITDANYVATLTWTIVDGPATP